MDEAVRKVDELIKVGDGFTYENFAVMDDHGYPEHYSPEWVSWRARVRGTIGDLFAEGSAPVAMLSAAGKLGLLGYDISKFNLARAHYMGALSAAQEILQKDTFGEIAGPSAKGPMMSSNRVFIVHGRNDAAKSELEVLLTEMGLEPIVLHRQADAGRTVIEKFEEYADVGFAFILLTPDEIAYLATEDAKPDDKRAKEYRARPNVIFEFGYFVGRLGRNRTCCLYQAPVTLPSDVSGIIYKKFSVSVEETGYAISKELRNAGYKLK